jgi:hypothetical protein
VEKFPFSGTRFVSLAGINHSGGHETGARQGLAHRQRQGSPHRDNHILPRLVVLARPELRQSGSRHRHGAVVRGSDEEHWLDSAERPKPASMTWLHFWRAYGADRP